MRLLKTTAAGLLVLLVVLAPPYLLIRYIGNPYPPEGLDLAAPLTDNAIMGFIAALVWILWAQFVLSLAVEGYAALTDRAADVRIPVFGVQQDLARALIAAIITTTVVAPLSTGMASPVDAATTRSAPGTGTTSSLTAPQWRGSAHEDRHRDAPAESTGQDRSTRTPSSPASTAQNAQKAQRAEQATETITVTTRRGDTLWSLAETYLGDGDRWSEISAANSGRTMTDGVVFTSANQIRPDWHIAVPGVPAAAPHDRDRDDRDVRGEQYRVEVGDTLSGIAEDQLGDATRFPEIFTASRDTTQPGGQHLSDPDVIDVGWTVTIPQQAGPRRGVPADTSARTGDRGRTPSGSAHHSALQHTTPGEMHHDDSPPAVGPHTSAAGAAPRAVTPPTSQTPSATPVPQTPSESPNHATLRDGSAQETAGASGLPEEAPWVLITGAGVVLAGGLLLGLRARRRAQLRARRPGRAIAAPARELFKVEASLAASAAAVASVEHMDAALRQLAAWSARERNPMPTLAAAELTGGSLVLHLTTAASLPAPWYDTAEDQLHWRAPVVHADAADSPPLPDVANSSISAAIEKDTDDTGDTDDVREVDAPYPLLVTVGSTDAGDVWLLNCEELGELRVTGDADRGRDFARYVVAELAMNPWSEQARVDCVALAEEVAPMNPDRVGHHPAANLEETAAAAVADAVITIDRAAAAGGRPVTGRTGQLDEDVWPARMLVVDATATYSGPNHESVEQHALQQLRELVGSHLGRTGTAVLMVGEKDCEEPLPNRPTAVEICVHRDGRLSVPSVGLELLAVGLSADEAHGCSALLTQSEDLNDVKIPVDEDAEDGWEAYVDTTGALRREHTVPRSRPAGELSEPVGSFLDAPTEAYVRVAAATADDLETLAPQVPVRLRAEVEGRDPGLDQDVADWFDDGCRRPRLLLLGPVTARAYGRPLAKQKPYIAEVLAYLASHRRNGVTPAQLASTFHITPNKAHSYTETLRAWLGINPRTGQPYLPHATKAPSAQLSGIGVYQIDQDVLVDRELFLRLRARGQARNAEGTTDLQRALSLVSGRPYDRLRVGGWEWLPALEPSDVSSAIADVAFLVTTRCMERGELEQARTAAEVAILVAPDSDAARLSLAAVIEAEGDRVEAERIVRDEICNRSDDGTPPTELSERTQAIIHNREWLTRARKTS